MTPSPDGTHLYLSTPSYLPPFSNTVARFDVASGTFSSPVWVGSVPDAMAVSDSEQYLYVVLDGSRSIVRLHLPDMTPDQQFHLYADGTFVDSDFLLRVPLNPTSVIAGRNDYTPASPYPRRSHFMTTAWRVHSATTDYTMLAYSAPLVNGADVSVDGTGDIRHSGRNSGHFRQPLEYRIRRLYLRLPRAADFPPQSFEVRCSQSFCLSGSGYLVDASTLPGN